MIPTSPGGTSATRPQKAKRRKEEQEKRENETQKLREKLEVCCDPYLLRVDNLLTCCRRRTSQKNSNAKRRLGNSR